MNKIKELLNKAKTALLALVEFVKTNPKRTALLVVLTALACGGLDYVNAQVQAARAAAKGFTDSMGKLEGPQVITFQQFQMQIPAKDVIIRLDGSLCYTTITSEDRVCVMSPGPTVIKAIR